MRKRLPCLRVHNQDWGDVVVEEDARYAAPTVHDLETQLIVLLVALCKVAPELSRAVLVGVDDPSAKGSKLGGDNLEEVLEHIFVLLDLEKERVSPKGRGHE